MPRPYIGVGALSPESLIEGEVSGRSFVQYLLVTTISRCCLLTKQHLLLQQEIKNNGNEQAYQKSEVVIHGTDGRIRDKDSYGNDPMPPKDTKN